MNIVSMYKNAIRNPRLRPWVILLTLVYIFSPIDIIPDFLLGLGWFDDLALLTVFATEMFKLFTNRGLNITDVKSFRKK